MTDLPEFLSTIPACAGMTGLELAALGAFLEPLRLAEGATLFREGESADAMYFVRSGRMGTWVGAGDGTRREVYEFGPGSHLGEMAIIEGSRRSATAYAKTDSLLLVLEALDFHRLVWDHPALAVKLLGNMARNMASWLDEAAGYLGDLARWGENARRRAVLDETTGLFNRRFLEESIRAREGRGIDERRPCCLVAFDLDRFHEVNRGFGNRAGDAVIAEVGALLQSRCAERGPEGAVAARLAGDEFSVLLPESGREEARVFAEELRAAIEALFVEFREGPTTPGRRLRITASFGCAEAPGDAPDGAGLVARADEALGRAKTLGRNRVECAEEGCLPLAEDPAAEESAAG